MTDRFTDPAYLYYQYADSEKLRIREEAHRLYSERPNDFLKWVVSLLALEPGHVVLDVGCGAGFYHPALGARRARILGLDMSFGMLEESRGQAHARGLPVAHVQANAQALPIVDAACDRVMANHMLYHVPDQGTALREMRRVLRPGGRVVLATVAADQNQRLRDLHVEVARSVGYTMDAGAGLRFTLDDLDLVRAVFPAVVCHVRPDAFQFPTPDAALRYYASGMIDSVRDRPADGRHRPLLLAAMRERVEAIIAREGVFRVAKNAGCFVADI